MIKRLGKLVFFYDIIGIGCDIVEKYVFTKEEIVTYLRDYSHLLIHTTSNPKLEPFDLFRRMLFLENRVQYSSKDHYHEMIKIFQILLESKFFTILYDNYFSFLSEENISKFEIPDEIFVNRNDSKRFSKKQIIRYIRNAFNHNDEHELLKFIRVNENNHDIVKMEIILNNVEPIPFHVCISDEQFRSIYYSIKKANSLLIVALKSLETVNMQSPDFYKELDKVYFRKFYSISKLSPEQRENIIKAANDDKKTSDEKAKIYSKNGLSFKDFYLSIEQKVKVEQDLNYWKKVGMSYENIIYHVINTVMPLSCFKEHTFLMNALLSDYLLIAEKPYSSFVNASKMAYVLKKSQEYKNLLNLLEKDYDTDAIPQEMKCFLPALSFFEDKENILINAHDIDNVYTFASAIYYGYLFDTLINDKYISISDSKKVDREHIRNSFVHLRWFTGLNNCFKLYDWKNGTKFEFNRNEDGFWKTNVPAVQMEECAESYYKNAMKNRDLKQHFLDMPIHLKKDFSKKDAVIDSISFTKNGLSYTFDLNNYILKVIDGASVRDANNEDIDLFLHELDNLTEYEKDTYLELINEIKKRLSRPMGH